MNRPPWTVRATTARIARAFNAYVSFLLDGEFAEWDPKLAQNARESKFVARICRTAALDC